MQRSVAQCPCLSPRFLTKQCSLFTPPQGTLVIEVNEVGGVMVVTALLIRHTKSAKGAVTFGLGTIVETVINRNPADYYVCTCFEGPCGRPHHKGCC